MLPQTLRHVPPRGLLRVNAHSRWTYRYHIDAAYRDIYGGALPSHPCMDAPLPEDISEDRPHIAFTPYLQQLTAGVVDGLEDPLDRARAIYDYLTQHIDYRYQPPYLLLGSIAR